MKNIKTWTSQSKGTLATSIQKVIEAGYEIISVVPLEYRQFQGTAIQDLTKALIVFK